MRNRLNNYNCCAGDIVILAVIAFLIFIVIYTLAAYVTGAFAMAMVLTEKEWEKLEAEDEKLHEEWAEENYEFVRCPNDTNTYPEDTKCGGPNIDWDEIRDNSEANREEEKAMKEADDD